MTGEELKRARRALGLSVDGFAKVFGVAAGRTVRGWELGERNGVPTSIPPPVVLLVKLALEFENVRKFLRISDNQSEGRIKTFARFVSDDRYEWGIIRNGFETLGEAATHAEATRLAEEKAQEIDDSL
jgi:hypothetical protein